MNLYDFLRNQECYSMSMKTMMDKHPEILWDNVNRIVDVIMCCPTTLLINGQAINIFWHEDDWYLGTQVDMDEYYQDKLNGTNPFYQTS